MSARASIYDVADAAGVSAATVSRVMNGSRLIGEEARRRVEQAARRLGYAPRRVRRQRERSILNVKLVLPRHEHGLKRLFYDFSELADGLRLGFAPCEVNLVTEVSRRGFDPFPHKKGGDIDAFVFAFQRPNGRLVREIRARGAEVVVLNRLVEGVPHVCCDDRNGMRQLAGHLSERGACTNIAFLGYEGIEDVLAERLVGFEEGARQHGLNFHASRDVYRFRSPGEVSGAEVRRLLQKGWLTFVCVNDVLGAVVLQLLRECNCVVPGEVRVSGFDDSPVRALVRPELTTVSMPVSDLARCAGRHLQAVLVDQEEFPESVKLQGKLLVGATT